MDHTLSMMQITPSLHKQASTATMPHLAPTWKLKVIKNTLASSLDSTLPSTTHWIQPCSFNIDEKIRSYCCPVNRWLSSGRGLLLCQWGWTRAKILKEYRSILSSSRNCSSTWSYAAGRGRAEQSSHVNCVVYILFLIRAEGSDHVYILFFIIIQICKFQVGFTRESRLCSERCKATIRRWRSSCQWEGCK